MLIAVRRHEFSANWQHCDEQSIASQVILRADDTSIRPYEPHREGRAVRVPRESLINGAKVADWRC
jgi:hypothetical protein